MKKPTKAKATKPVTKPANEAPKDDAVLRTAFDQGRKARHTGIGRTDAPHGGGAELDSWLKGWDFEDGI